MQEKRFESPYSVSKRILQFSPRDKPDVFSKLGVKNERRIL